MSAVAGDQSTPVVSDSVSSLRQALPAVAGVQGTLVISDFVSRSGRQTMSAAAVPTVSAAVPAVSTASVVQITPAVSESVEDFYMKIWKNKTSTSPWYNRSVLLPNRLHDKRHRFWPYRLSFYSRVKYIQRLCITPRKQVFSGNQKKRKKNNCSNQDKWNHLTQESFSSGNLGLISLTEISVSDSNDSSTTRSIIE